MEKLYTLAGTSKIEGIVTYRFASQKRKDREGILRRNGHSEVNLLDTPREMTANECIAWLNAQGIFAVLPYGHRKVHYGKLPIPAAEVLDAHVQSWIADTKARAAKLAERRARDAARKREKRAAAKAA